MHTRILWITGFAVILALTLGGVAHAVSSSPALTASLDGQATLPSAMRSKLLAPPTRATMVNALLSNPIMKAMILKKTQAAGIGESQVNTLTTRSLATMMSSTTSVIKQLNDAIQADYARINWTAGLTFTANSVPTYYSGRYHVGDLLVTHASVLTSSPDLLYVILPPQATHSWGTGFLELNLELPTGPGIYMIALKLVKAEGECPATMVGAMESTSPIQAALNYSPANGTSNTVVGIPFTPLSDNSGYVGILSVDIGTQSSTPRWPTMRRLNAMLQLAHHPEHDVSPYSRRLVFRSVTITKL